MTAVMLLVAFLLAWNAAACAQTVTMSASVNPVATGDPITITATVTGNVPTGTIQFKDHGSINMGPPVPLDPATGRATFTTSALNPGVHNFSGVYSGDANNAPSTSPYLRVEALPTQRWPEVPDDAWVLMHEGNSTTTPAAGIAAYSGMVHDSTRDQLLIFGGGHLNYNGNGVWAFDLRSQTLSRLTPDDPVQFASLDECNAAFDPVTHLWNTGRPWIRETFNSQLWLPSIGRMIIGGAAGWGFDTLPWRGCRANTYGPDDTWFFDPVTRSWTLQGVSHVNPASQPHWGYGAYDHATRTVYALTPTVTCNGTMSIARYSVDANTWTYEGCPSAIPLALYPGDAMAVTWDDRRGRLLVFSGYYYSGPQNNDRIIAYDPQTRSWSEVPATGTRPPSGGYYTIAYDSVNDVLLAHKSGDYNPMWIYRFDSQSWVRGAVGPYDRSAAPGTLRFDPSRNLAYLEALNRVSNTIDLWAYRYRAASTPAPSTTVLQSSPAKSIPGEAVTFSATVTSPSGVPGGTVTFRNGKAPMVECTDVVLVGGRAQCTVSSLEVGTHPISVEYSGDATTSTGLSDILDHRVGAPSPPA